MARSRVMLLQSSKEHKVNGMTTKPWRSLTPQPLSLKGEGVLRAGIIFMGILNPLGEGIKHYGHCRWRDTK